MVKANVKRYFEGNAMPYEVMNVLEKLNDPNIYVVVARHTNYPKLKRDYGGNEYVVWTCWNESTQSLNFGHYDLDYEQAKQIALEYVL